MYYNYDNILTGLFGLQIPIILKKDPSLDERGNPVYDEAGKPCYRCGFKIGGGMDQDPSKSPQGYPDKVGLHYLSFLQPKRRHCR